ncbi:hypothetical protein PACTADRAFT_52180 [Pachysolen tannophilus NRRL Y-2460]|uniref:MHD domain-containing protein n=1 Tax=Pachysolen tannophilus NRRL Y-2460 TaxID=669874 RepID=A0A1E4TMT1_PACTA|nr:hypothetical protein PACTADRAFT_52180 [Pachysolen tannophilus NRRL Y-2460]
MASSIHFLDIKGKPLLSRDYKGDIPSSALEKFPLLIIEQEQSNNGVPILNDQGINYIYILHNNIYILALTKKNENVFSIMIYLSNLIKVLTNYFKNLEEESIRDNFVVIYELLDETMDFGIAQITDPKILKEYITQESHKLELLTSSNNNEMKQPPNALTNAISWRSEGIFYKKNEAFLDVVESINMTVNHNGQILMSEILGKIKIKSQLSGMPDLRLGLNEKFLNSAKESGNNASGRSGIELEDIKFHQCVRLSKFENEKIITFIPPDGEFDLMSYRILSPPLKPLFVINYKFQNHSNTRLEIFLKVRLNFKQKLTCQNLEIFIPVPDDIDSPKFQTVKGNLKYLPESSCIRWKFKSCNGGKEYAMLCELLLPSTLDAKNLEIFKKKPIKFSFNIPYFTTSGLQVKYLRINEPKLNYQSYPWVRYITQSGDHFEYRV